MRRGEGLPNDERTTAARRLAAPRCITVSRIPILALALMLSGPALAAGFQCEPPPESDASPPASSNIKELDEILVDGSKSRRKTRELGEWLKRLEGQYRYEGYVDLCGHGNPDERRPVTGKADCAALYHHGGSEPPTSLYCVIDVRWQQVQGEDGMPVMGSETNLSPAVAIYGVVPDLPGIQSMQIDNKGIATHATGRLVGDTLTSRESCGMYSSCQKVTRITAEPDSTDIAMLIDFEVDSRRVLRQSFLLHQVSKIELDQDGPWVYPVGTR